MLRDEPTLTPGLFRLPEDPVGPRVLIPGFRSSSSVRGAFGWFTAGWIARLAPGLAEYLARDDAAPIEFTVSPSLFSAELEAIQLSLALSPEEACQRVADVWTNGSVDADALAVHALDCLSWMLATGRLTLQVAVPTPESNYHPKLWMFDDGRDQVVARGSGNATGKGVAAGVEHLDVDVSWEEASVSRVVSGLAMLNDWARGNSAGIDRVVPMPEALEEQIIRLAPDTVPRPEDYLAACAAAGTPRWAVDPSEVLRARFAPKSTGAVPRLVIPDWLEWQTGRYSHQAEAVAEWEATGPLERGTIAMATGAGKTLTALICATRLQDRSPERRLLVVVSAPAVPLIEQWAKVISDFGVIAATPTLEGNTALALTNFFRGLEAGGTHVMVVTNHLLCSRGFQRTLAAKVGTGVGATPTMLVADEAHTLGAEGFVQNQPQFFGRRLALSATPERQYDPDGTEQIFQFFGPPVYEFGLDRAIGFCLVPYRYYVHTATLGGDELEEFAELTRRLGAAMGQGGDDDTIKKLRIRRRRVIETAALKIEVLRRVLERRGPRQLSHALIYASAKKPEQFEQIGELLSELDIRWAPVTQETTRSPQLLRETLVTFENGGYQVLLAKKVLDEGVDIPTVREAFIIASSTVQREWIQRRGRVLRMHPSKPWALLHDFLALPPADLVRDENVSSIKRIIRSELDRAYSFAAHASNAAGNDGVMESLEQVRGAFWATAGLGQILQEPGDMALAPSLPEGRPW